MTEIDCRLVLFVSLLSWIGETAGRFIGWRCLGTLALGKSYSARFLMDRFLILFSSLDVWRMDSRVLVRRHMLFFVFPYRNHHVYPWCAQSIPQRRREDGRSTVGERWRQTGGNAGKSRTSHAPRRKSSGKCGDRENAAEKCGRK